MAKRRALGSALTRQSETLQDMVQAMIRARIQEESQARLFAQQDKLESARNKNIADRQAELAGLQAQQRKDQYMLENPAAALPGPTRMAQGVGEGIDKADAMEKLPTRLGVATSMGGTQQPFPMPMGGGMAMIPGPTNRPEIAQLLAQRAQKEEALKAELERKRKEAEDAKLRIGPTGASGFMSGTTFVPTERTGEQEGSRQATIEKTTRPGAISRAAGVEAGQTGARIDTEHGRIDKVRELAQARDTSEPAGAGGESRKRAAQEALSNFKMLSADINRFDGEQQLIEGGKRKLGALMNRDNNAIEFERVRRPLAMQLTVLIQGSRPTDTDVLIQGDLLPGFTTPSTVAKRLIAAAESMINTYEPGTISREDLFAILEAAKSGSVMSPGDAKKLLGGRGRGGGY